MVESHHSLQRCRFWLRRNRERLAEHGTSTYPTSTKDSWCPNGKPAWQIYKAIQATMNWNLLFETPFLRRPHWNEEIAGHLSLIWRLVLPFWELLFLSLGLGVIVGVINRRDIVPFSPCFSASSSSPEASSSSPNSCLIFSISDNLKSNNTNALPA